VHADADGRAVVRLEHIARDGAVAAFAVSLEATGGSPDHHKPAGPVVMLGKLAG
jgi:anti-sigma-K factor RskA